MYLSWFHFIFHVLPIHSCDSHFGWGTLSTVPDYALCVGFCVFLLYFFPLVMTMHWKQTPLQFVLGFIITSYQIANGRVTIWLNSINLFFPSFSILPTKSQAAFIKAMIFSFHDSTFNVWQHHFFWQRRHLFKTFRWIYFMLMADDWWLMTRKKYIDRKQSVGNSKPFK